MATEREKLLLSPENYFELADNALRSCQYVATAFDGPQISKNMYHFSGVVSFHGDHKLNFSDTCFLESRFALTRDINYDFRTAGSLIETFRFDNHGNLLQLNEACHLHLNGEPELYDGDPLLKGYSLIDMHLLEVISLVCKFLRGEVLPWQ